MISMTGYRYAAPVFKGTSVTTKPRNEDADLDKLTETILEFKACKKENIKPCSLKFQKGVELTIKNEDNEWSMVKKPDKTVFIKTGCIDIVITTTYTDGTENKYTIEKAELISDEAKHAYKQLHEMVEAACKP